MNSRERVLAAIDRQPVDRIPTDIWATPEVWAKLRDRFGDDADVRAQLNIDGIYPVWCEYAGPPLPEMPEGETVNYWGSRTRRIQHLGGTYDEQVFYPLALAGSIDDLGKYNWPTTDWFDYSHLAEKARELRSDRVVKCGYMAPFSYHNWLRGLEQSLIDPLDDPEFTHVLIDRLCDFIYDHHRRMFEAAAGLIDISEVTDDLGTQTGPMISMETYEEFYAPQHQRFIDLCGEFGIRVFHHDDGGIRPFIPRLIEMGIDVLNPIQWTCPEMDMVELKTEFGEKVCFHGAIDNQRTLPFGTPDEVRAEVRRCIDSLASDSTGYILAPCHNIQGHTPLENIIAMYDEAREYGKVGDL